MGRLRIYDKIVVPFVLMAIVATVAASLVALSLISNTLTSRVDSQIASGAALVSHSLFALNPSILEQVKSIAGGDVITFSSDGRVLAATLDPGGNGRLIAAVTDREATRAAEAGAGTNPLMRDVELDGVDYAIAYHRVLARPDTFVAVVANTSAMAGSERAARRTVLVGAGLSLLLLIIVSRFVARRVAAPLEELLAFTRDVIPGTTARRATVSGDDEVARLAQAFNDMLDRLQASQEAQVRSEKLALAGLLAARVAHEVRNPLSSIKMLTQLLRSRLHRADEEDNRALLDSVLHDIDQVETVVRGMLELAKPGELNIRRTPLSAIVEDVLRQVSPQMAHRKIEVETALAADLPELPLDQQRFRQALLNIIVNAADAMPDGGTLSITAGRTPEGSSVVLDVCDDGVGIDPMVTGRLFDAFVSTKRDGVGLGLVNTKAIIESHGGTIGLTPRQGRGTRARITLPVT